jgi:hypothetical protein
MQEEQHRVAPVIAPDGDPLLDAADLDVFCLVNTVRGGNRVVLDVAAAKERQRRVELPDFGIFRRDRCDVLLGKA